MKAPIHSKGEEKQSSQKRSGAKIRKTRKFFWGSKKRTLLSFLSLLVLIGGVSAFFIFADPQVKSASFGWLQTDWSGGETENTATHENDQTGWTEFTEKDNNVDISTSGEITLSNSEGGSFSRGNAEDEAFEDSVFKGGPGNVGGGYSDSSGALTIKKKPGKPCQTDGECAFEGTCVDGVCQGINTLLTSFRVMLDNTNTYDFVIFDEEVSSCEDVTYDNETWNSLSDWTVGWYKDNICNNDNNNLDFSPYDLPKKLISDANGSRHDRLWANCDDASYISDSAHLNRHFMCYREVEVLQKD